MNHHDGRGADQPFNGLADGKLGPQHGQPLRGDPTAQAERALLARYHAEDGAVEGDRAPTATFIPKG